VSNNGSNYVSDSTTNISNNIKQAPMEKYKGDTVPVKGMLEILPNYGVIRQPEQLEDDLPRDVYISPSQIKRFSLRK